MVANRRQERVLWLCDNPTELAVCSIYRTRGQWLLNLEWRAGGRRERRALAQEMRGFHRVKVTGDERTR
jgi:hypothetical protein